MMTMRMDRQPLLWMALCCHVALVSAFGVCRRPGIPSAARLSADQRTSNNNPRRLPPTTILQSSPLPTPAVDDPITVEDDDSKKDSLTPPTLNCGLLFSSFNDGLKCHDGAHAFFRRGLAQAVLAQQQRAVETQLAASAEQSPCCGPQPELVDQLEATDDALARVWGKNDDDMVVDDDDDDDDDDQLTQIFSALPAEAKVIRLAYIPTAMYALRPDSNNTPGKQRQRARADGKKRRNNIVALLQRLMNDHQQGAGTESDDWDIQAVTIDLDDDSVKQATSTGAADGSFPTNGKAALQDWNPHLVYVEGGNTFWLHYCMEKGGYNDILSQTLSSPTCCYCGSSAGAIVAGATVQTACWKGWDDPRVVPGRERYEDWGNVAGLNLVRGASFFPHMDPQWEKLVNDQRRSLESDQLVCLNEDQVYCFRGVEEVETET